MFIATHGAVAQTCDGKYTEADALIEAAYTTYGTLYSGGKEYGSVGPTLEIYRLLNDLPNSGMATPRPSNAAFVDPDGYYDLPDFVGETLMRSLPRIHDPDFRRDLPEGSTDSEVLLYRLIALGPYSGWWLTPDTPHLTPIEQVIAQYAVDDGLDWLLTVQAASAQPHNISWRLNDFRDGDHFAGAAVLANALNHYGETQDLAWLVAAFLTVQDDRWRSRLTIRQRDTLIEANTHLDTLQTEVEDCSATLQAYVAFSIARYEDIRISNRSFQHLDEKALTALALFPQILRQMAAMQLTKSTTFRPPWRQEPTITPAYLSDLLQDPRFDQWLNVGRSFRANSVDELIEVNADVPLAPQVMRLLNILSVDDLFDFAASRAGFDREHQAIFTVAFLRLFALGRDNDAAAKVEELRQLWPDLAPEMAAVWERQGPLDVRLARVAVTIPNARVLVVPYAPSWREMGDFEGLLQSDGNLRRWTQARRSRDLPLGIRTGGYLNRDLRHWMQAIGSAPESYWSAQRRAYRRSLSWPNVMRNVNSPLPEAGIWYRNDRYGPAQFAAWDELARLGPETGLANRIGTVLVAHAEASTRNFWTSARADKDQLAAEMAMVIRQGRRMIHGTMNGRPLGQAAFAVLHGPLSDTEAAQATPYWFICRQRCEP